jgi:single-strand DNA-binding protein
MKKISIIGNVTRDAEIKQFDGGRSVINFDVAVNERYKDKNGQKIEHTSFIRCAMWRDNADIAQHILKGKKLYVEGTPEVEAYISTKDNKAIGVLKINVRQIEFLGGPAKTEQSKDISSEETVSSEEETITASAGDDLPF